MCLALFPRLRVSAWAAGALPKWKAAGLVKAGLKQTATADLLQGSLAQCTEEAASVMDRLVLTFSSKLLQKSRWESVGTAYAKSSTVSSTCCCKASLRLGRTLQSLKPSAKAAEMSPDGGAAMLHKSLIEHLSLKA